MDKVAALFNICDPLKPPPKGAYVELCQARGESQVVPILAKGIRRAESNNYLLFSGHPGSGKSTELRRLCENLKTGDSRFFPVYMDADEYINRLDVDVTDILLMIVGIVAESLRNEEEISLKSPYLEKRWEELKEFLFTDVEIEKIEVPLAKYAKLIAKLKRADNDSRNKVRDKLSPQLPSILGEINIILERAKVELKKKDYRGLVLVIDNLEKLRDQPNKPDLCQRIFINGGEQLSAISTHVVFTIPLPLIHSPQHTSLVSIYGQEPIILPMVKVEEKNLEPYENGLELMQEVLRRRFNISEIGDSEVFDSLDTFKYLCQMSGGHVKNLIVYFRTASDYIESLPFTISAVKKGVQRHINAYSRSIPEKNWELLAKLHLNPNKQIPNDDDHREMLGDLSILEYMNGGEPWHSVNPVVRELAKFKSAVEKLSDSQKGL